MLNFDIYSRDGFSRIYKNIIWPRSSGNKYRTINNQKKNKYQPDPGIRMHFM